MLPAYLRKLWALVADREFVVRFDGLRWWADAPTDANYPTSTALAFHALSELGLFLAPTDGGEFLDVAGIAATNVLIAELRSRVATRLARLRLQDPAAEAACQQVLDAVSDLENDLVDLARAARKAFNDNGRNRH
jgi:hypothetical protein